MLVSLCRLTDCQTERGRVEGREPREVPLQVSVRTCPEQSGNSRALTVRPLTARLALLTLGMSSKTSFIVGLVAAVGLASWFADGGEKAHQAPKLVRRATEKMIDSVKTETSPSWGYPDRRASSADQAREVCMGD